MIIDLKVLAWRIERRWILIPWRWSAGWAVQGLGGGAALVGGTIAVQSPIFGVLGLLAAVFLAVAGWAIRSAE